MPRRVLQGVVVSDKGEKTIIVLVERRVMHPIYKVHQALEEVHGARRNKAFKAGDVVKIREAGPSPGASIGKYCRGVLRRWCMKR